MDTSAFIFLHVTAGTTALLSGGTALLVRKGEPVHRLAGNVFLVAMVLMCAGAIPVAIARQQTLNIAAASFTLYLLATSWRAATRNDGESGSSERVAFFTGMGIAAGALAYGALGPRDAAPFFYAFGSLAAFAALMDLTVIIRKGVSGAQRIARHLWRMSLAMLIATASFFIGQPKFVPGVVRDANLHFVPVIAVMALLLFWLLRVLLTRWADHTYGSTPNMNAPTADQVELGGSLESRQDFVITHRYLHQRGEPR
ncbi:MAG: hypothetical protein KBA31_14650 [Alphaproteobacteria bacterium]|nr:hypothetical protein [Alphaproteobacteria bacterium]